METAVKDDNQLMDEIQKSQGEKSTQFIESLKENPNKRLYQQRIVIQWAEVIDIDKDALRYVDNAADEKYNQELMKKAATDYSLEAMQFAKQIQDNEKFCIEEFEYSSREYSCNDRCPKKDVKVHAIDLNNAPAEVQEILKSIIQGVKKN